MAGESWQTASLAADKNPSVTAIDRQITELIGDEGYATLEDMSAAATDGYSGTVNLLAAGIADESTPLTSDQADGLLRMYYEVNDPARNPDAANPASTAVDPQTLLTPLGQTFLSRASAILSADQLNSLRSSLSDPNRLDAIANKNAPPRGLEAGSTK